MKLHRTIERMLKTFLLIVLVFAAAPSICGQKCGASYFGIYTPNRKKIEYKLFSLFPRFKYRSEYEVLKNLLSTEKIKGLSLGGTLQVESKLAEKFLKDYKSENFYNLSNLESVELYGSSDEGTFSFKTSEGDAYFYLLQVSTDKLEIAYFVGNYLGGCGKRQLIDFDKLQL